MVVIHAIGSHDGPYSKTMHPSTISGITGGTIVSRTYGTHKNPYIALFLPTIFGPIYLLWSPVILILILPGMFYKP